MRSFIITHFFQCGERTLPFISCAVSQNNRYTCFVWRGRLWHLTQPSNFKNYFKDVYISKSSGICSVLLLFFPLYYQCAIQHYMCCLSYHSLCCFAGCFLSLCCVFPFLFSYCGSFQLQTIPFYFSSFFFSFRYAFPSEDSHSGLKDSFRS